MSSPVDTAYRAMSVETLEALKLSFLTQLKSVEGVGQSHSTNSRSTTLPDIDKLTQKIVNIDAALAFKANPANAGNNGYARRFASFNNGCSSGYDQSY